jgi:hypothetical protein
MRSSTDKGIDKIAMVAHDDPDAEKLDKQGHRSKHAPRGCSWGLGPSCMGFPS